MTPPLNGGGDLRGFVGIEVEMMMTWRRRKRRVEGGDVGGDWI